MAESSTKSDPYAKYLQAPAAADPYEKYMAPPARDPYEKYLQAPAALDDQAILGEYASGKSPQLPHQTAHPDVSFGDRFRIMFRGGNPEVARKFLEDERGFEVQPLGGFQFALRKGKGDWYHFDEPGTSLQDITDVAGDVLSLGGLIGGSVAGTAAGGALTLGSPAGAFSGGVTGAAAGTGLAQGVRQAGAALMGLPTPAEEILPEIGEEAASGAAGELLGVGAAKLLGAGARAIKRGRIKMRAKRRAKMHEAEEAQAGVVKLPTKPPQGADVDQETWEWLVRNDPETARKVAFGTAEELEIAAKTIFKNVPTKPATHEEMVRAIESLGPRDPAVAEFIRRTRSARTGQEQSELRTLLFQGRPDLDREATRVAWRDARTLSRTPEASHLSEPQLQQLVYRRIVHGLSDEAFREALSLTRGMPPREITELIESLSFRFPYRPREHGIIGPVVDIEARAEQIRRLGHVPWGDRVDFWRSIPLEGLRHLQLPDGTVLKLTQDQAKAARHVVADIATHGIPFRTKVGAALTKLGQMLRVPKTQLFRALKAVGMDFAGRWHHPRGTAIRRFQAMAPPLGAALAGGTLISPKIGFAVAGAYGLGILGRGMERFGRMIIADRTGGVLHAIAAATSERLGRKIQRVLGFLANDRLGLYRIGVYELLSDPEFQQAAEKTLGAPGDGGDAGGGARPGPAP